MSALLLLLVQFGLWEIFTVFFLISWGNKIICWSAILLHVGKRNCCLKGTLALNDFHFNYKFFISPIVEMHFV